MYEFVRDNISHSADINADLLTCSASEVLNAGHGICFAKAHLLAALLRCKSIPAGFCYQKLILDDETAPVTGCDLMIQQKFTPFEAVVERILLVKAEPYEEMQAWELRD